MAGRIALAVTERGPFADGHAFGDSGPYEVVAGRARIRIDPASVPADAIADLDLAPRDGDGFVAVVADFEMLRPAEPARGNRRVLFDYGNRGNKRALQFFNDAPHSNRPRSLAHAGNGFLMRRGFTVVWLGWQGDLLPGDDRLLLDLPVARGKDGPVTGTVRSEFIFDAPGTRVLPLSGRINTRSHPAVSLDPSRARLTRRRYAGSEPELVPPEAWSFAREESGIGLDNQGGVEAVIPSDVHIRLAAGFEPGWIYELAYEGRDPLVLGLGHAAVRDFVAFLKFDDEASPLAGARPEKCYAWGRSQTGRCIRDFVHLGFNDAGGRRVFDGVFPHVSGAGRMAMHRFANLTYGGTMQHEDRSAETDRFPFAYAPSVDPATGATDAILRRPQTDPLVIHTQSSTEYWNRRGSLVHTDADGRDLPDAEGARVYLWASTQHYSDPNLGPPKRGVGQNYDNTVQTSFLFRALLDALDRWASDGVPPPPSRVPSSRRGTVAEWRARFPAIPGLALPTRCNELPGYAVVVPLTDADGNEVAGLRAPMMRAPLGTYAGWNVRARGQGQ
ncbi:MAG TPA: alpha/beta hydrolase domain-containing protein, partial [Beijerinckiaceae bacterium]|nr:alpha/beta hydrolase domain-containing protein [Beijerinckiaceae bacterium]